MATVFVYIYIYTHILHIYIYMLIMIRICNKTHAFEPCLVCSREEANDPLSNNRRSVPFWPPVLGCGAPWARLCSGPSRPWTKPNSRSVSLDVTEIYQIRNQSIWKYRNKLEHLCGGIRVFVCILTLSSAPERDKSFGIS